MLCLRTIERDDVTEIQYNRVRNFQSAILCEHQRIVCEQRKRYSPPNILSECQSKSHCEVVVRILTYLFQMILNQLLDMLPPYIAFQNLCDCSAALFDVFVHLGGEHTYFVLAGRLFPWHVSP